METYAIDIDTSRELIAHGGSTNCVEIYDYATESPVFYAGEFSDSILYVQFLDKGLLLVVVVDGTITILDGTSEIAANSTNENVSVAAFSKDHLIVGSELGNVYLYDVELNLIAVCTGHSSPVMQVRYHEDRIYSLSDQALVIHDAYGNTISTFRANMASTFCNISGEVFCISRDNRAQVFKGTKKLFEINLEDGADMATLVGTNLVLCGAFPQIILIDTLRHYGVCRLDIGVEIVECEAYDENRIIFSTVCGCIGILDIRDVRTLKMYEAGVGTIYTFKFSGIIVVYGGEEGTGIINLEKESVQRLDAFSMVE